tara:strand:+ start:43014 stop:43229 length:216 start_codon:yes stop_codon:yes gene_type:complete
MQSFNGIGYESTHARPFSDLQAIVIGIVVAHVERIKGGQFRLVGIRCALVNTFERTFPCAFLCLRQDRPII